jgi:hypothetical protein
VTGLLFLLMALLKEASDVSLEFVAVASSVIKHTRLNTTGSCDRPFIFIYPSRKEGYALLNRLGNYLQANTERADFTFSRAERCNMGTNINNHFHQGHILESRNEPPVWKLDLPFNSLMLSK